jgi:acyl carrier protein
MNTLQVLQGVLVSAYQVPPEKVTPAATLATLGLDSLGVIELMFKIEDAFALKITDDPPSNLQTVGDVVAYVDGLLQSRDAAQTAA